MVSYNSKFLAATVQAEPVWLDADATIDKSIGIIEEAAQSASLIAFRKYSFRATPIGRGRREVQPKLYFTLSRSLELGDDRMRRLQLAARRNRFNRIFRAGSRIALSERCSSTSVARSLPIGAS
jgi:aliphatic nitrilase